MKNKRFKRTQRKNSKPSKQVKRFKPVTLRLREKRATAVAQEAEARYQYHQLRNGYLRLGGANNYGKHQVKN